MRREPFPWAPLIAGRAAFWIGIVATVLVVGILTRIARRALGRALREKPA